MALDIRGSLKNTRINNKPFVFVDELLANAIDSYLIRKSQEPSLADGLSVDFIIAFYKESLFGDEELNLKITCQDNGAGFGNEQVKAFTTKDTSYKDDLPIGGIGKCRGLGRIQFLHYFRIVRIESVYGVEGKLGQRMLSIDTSSTKEIDESSFVKASPQDQRVQTRITLETIKREVYQKFYADKNLRDDFSADALKQHVMINFLQRFVSLKDTLGSFKITFKTVFQDRSEFAALEPPDLPTRTTSRNLEISYQDADGCDLPRSEIFTVSQYRLEKSAFRLKSNLVALCAKSATVESITRRYLKTKTLETSDIGGFYHVILIESDYLDEYVNGTRDGFDIPENSQQTNMFVKDLISREQIFDLLDDVIASMISPPDWDKSKFVEIVCQKYGITKEMIAESKIRIHYGDSEEKVVKRVMGAYQDKVIKATSDIFDIKTEIAQTDPTSAQFRDKINDLAWRYTSSLRDIDMMNLSQLVVRRAAILEILNLAIEKALPAQASQAGKRCDEKFIHNILFPMGKDSNETKNHDIWLLNEEYQYFDYISSDRALSKIMYEGQPLFDATVDAELEAVLKRIYKGNEAKRPDIAIFGNEGAAIIIELKAPGVSLDDHVPDLMEYSVLLAAKSGGRLRRFYGYLLGDTMNPNRLRGYTPFPNNNGYFATDTVKDFVTNTSLGTLYSEILYYKDIVDRAGKRLDEYKKRIGLRFR